MKKPTPIEMPSREYRDALYQIYLTIFEQRNILNNNHVSLMTSLLGRQRWSWRVTAVSKGAIEVLKSREFKNAKGLQRDHFIQNRNTTYNLMLPETGEPLSSEEWWKQFWHNDATVLLTKEEHHKLPKVKLMLYKLNWEEGYFTAKKFIGFNYRKTLEGAFLKNLIERDEQSFLSLEELLKEHMHID